MIFGISSRLSKCGKKLTFYYDDRVINVLEMYKYLVTILENTLSHPTNFDTMYKKTTSKLRRLYSLRMYLDSSTKDKIFKAIILLCNSHNRTINLNLSKTQRQKLQTKHSVMLVRKFVQRTTCENVKDYFKTQSHNRVTRSNNYLLQTPKTKLKYAKNGFSSRGCNTLQRITN